VFVTFSCPPVSMLGRRKQLGVRGGGKVVQVFLVRGHTHYAMKASYSRRIVAL